jgi:hypothetical protein
LLVVVTDRYDSNFGNVELGGVQRRELAHMPKAVGKCTCFDLQWLVAGEQQPRYCPGFRYCFVWILTKSLVLGIKITIPAGRNPSRPARLD